MLKHWFLSPNSYCRRFILEQLEERIVLDAAGGADAQNAADNTDSDIDDTDGAQQSSDTSEATEGSAGYAESDDTVADVLDQDLGEVLASNTLDVIEDASGTQEAVRVLVISSTVQDADQLAEAAQDDVLAIVYDGSDDSPETILANIEESLDGREAESIAFAVHDLGEGGFHLTCEYTVSPSTILGSTELQSFWEGVARHLTDDGRIDIMACDLASCEAGNLLVSQLENLTGHDVAASDDPTGNPDDGGDWILETDNVDLVSLYFVQSALDDFDGTLAAEDKLTAKDPHPYDQFGRSVSIDGDYCIVGAPGCDIDGVDSGVVYIYQHLSNGTWGNAVRLTASDVASEDRFGRSVSISGDYCIVGAYGDGDNGSVYIYQHLSNGVWGNEVKLTASDGASGDYFGWSVSISEDYCIVGAYGDDDNGSVYIYQHLSNGTWGNEVKLTASDSATGGSFGVSVSISGGYCIVGAYGDSGNAYNSGSAYIYELLADGTWGNEDKVTASDAERGDCFGWSVSISGDYCIVGAYGDDDNGNSSGSAYIYELLADGTWGNEDKVTASDAVSGDYFGNSVSISGDYCIVGAYLDSSEAGSAYVYERDAAGNFSYLTKLTQRDGALRDYFGYSVSGDGDYCIVGAYGDDDADINAGSAYVYYLPGLTVDLDASGAGTGYLVTFTSGGPAVDIADDDVSINDWNDTYLESAVVTLTNPLDGAEEGLLLSGALPPSLSLTDYDPATGVLVISGHGTLAEYEAAIELIQYNNVAEYAHSEDRIINVQVHDGSHSSDIAVSNVTVEVVNHDPTAVNDDADVGISTGSNADTTLGTSVILANDHDLNPSDTLSVTSVSGTSAAGGLVTLDTETNAITYNPNGQFDYLASGVSATDTFTYTISDGNGGSDTATVTVTVIGNDYPTAVDDNASVGITTDEDTSTVRATSEILANDYDVDPGNTISVTSVSGTSAAGGLVTLDTETNAITYNPNGQFDYLAEGESATDTFTYTITDNHGATDTATVTVTITGVNDNPTAVDDDPNAATINIHDSTTLTFSTSVVLANDHDADAPDTLSVASVSGTSASGALVTLYATTNEITYDTNGQFDGLAVGESTTDTFTYTVTDGNGGTDTATVTVTISNTTHNVASADDSKLTATDGDADDNYGYSVSIYGNYAIVGAPFNDQGCVYIYEIDANGNWGEEIIITSSDGAVGDHFGYSVSIDGNYCIIGAPGDDDNSASDSGSVYIYRLLDDGTWAMETKLTAEDPADYDEFGCSVSISNGYCIVGAKHDGDNGPNSGSAYVYRRISIGNWSYQAKLTAGEDSDMNLFGNSVSISGSNCIVGAYNDSDDGYGSGSAYIYHRLASGEWTEVVKLTASDAARGDHFGCSVSIDGSYCVVGAYGDDDNGSDSGSAYIYWLYSGVWREQAKLTASDAAGGDYFGYSVSIDGGYCVVGAYGDNDNGSDSGSVYIYERLSGGAWGDETKWTPDDGEKQDNFGRSVSISGDFALVGADGDDDMGNDEGAAYLIQLMAPALDLDWTGDGTGYAATFIVGGEAVDIADDDVSITDQDDEYLQSAVATLTNRPDGMSEGLSLSGSLPGSLTLTTAYDPATGELVISGTGTLAEYQAAIELIQYYNVLGSPDTADRTIEVTVNDGVHSSNVALSMISVTNAPVAADDTYGVTEGFSVSGNVITDTAGQDSDPDGDSLTATLLSGPGYGTLTAFHADGSFTYLADDEHWNALRAGETQDVTFTYTVSDGKGGTDTATVTITVTGENDEPTAADDDASIAEPETTYTTGVLIADPDAAYPDLSVNISGSPSSTGTLAYNGNGTFTYTYTGGELSAGDKVFETFTYTVSDLDGGTESGAITVTVTGVNDDPVAADDAYGVMENSSVSGNVITDTAGQDSDAEGDALTATLVTGPAYGTLTGFHADGSFTYVADGEHWESLPHGVSEDVIFTYTVSDGNGGSDTATVTITVTGVNDVPTSADNTVNTDEDVPYIFQASDFDFTDADAGNTIQTVIITDLPDEGTIYWNNVVVQLGNEIPIEDINSGGLVFKSGENAYGLPYDSFGFQVSDGMVNSASSYTMTVNVQDVNDEPVVSVPADVILPKNATVDITGISISDADVKEGSGEVRVTITVEHGTLTLAQTTGLAFDSGSSDNSANMTFTGLLEDVNDALATVTYTQAADYHGNDSLLISVDDQGNYGGGDARVVDTAVSILMESSELPNKYSDDSLSLTGGASESGPLRTTGTMAAVGNLLGALSEEGFLPEVVLGETGFGNQSVIVSQFGTLMHSAIFGEDSEARNHAWEELLDLVTGEKPTPGTGELLGLAEFLSRLQEWQIGKSLDELVLVFNADAINLANWLHGLMAADLPDDHGAIVVEPVEFLEKPACFHTRVFDMENLSLVDFFDPEFADTGLLVGCKTDMAPGIPVCRVFDADEMSLLEAIAS